MAMSDQVAIMHRGRIEQIGVPQDVYRSPATRFVAGFLGAMNWFGNAGVRPESLRVSRNGQGWRCSATVTQSLFLGSCSHVMMRLESGEQAVAEVRLEEEEFRPGEAVHLYWSDADEIRFPQ